MILRGFLAGHTHPVSAASTIGRLPALAIVGAILIIAAGILSEWRPKRSVPDTAKAVQT